MAAKRLSAFTAGINFERRIGTADPVIHSIAYDSRMVGRGALFFALGGLHTDGFLFIDDATRRGAAAVVCAREPERPRDDVVYLVTADPRRLLSPVSAEFYDHPSKRIPVIGVTGTDGKSTTVFLIYQLLERLGHPAGFLSTVQIKTGSSIAKNHYRQSTPEACEIQAILAEMASRGKEYAVIEATSHGLSMRTARLADVRFRVGVMTNVTHEHLEFHGTFEQYRSDKANLFRALDGPRAFGVVNLEDPSSDFFRRAARAPVLGYSALAQDGADLAARDVKQDPHGISFTIVEREGQSRPARINLPGLFNLDNALAAILAVRRLTSAPLDTIIEHLPSLEGAQGRMHVIHRGQPFAVIVDYAHTPGAFSRLLPAMREQTRGRLVAVFGSAGERDVAKRRIQGEIADRYCDIIILTDEDPRGEKPESILEEIASGIGSKVRGETLYLIAPRKDAFRKAFELARDGDTVLLLGKGHEATIIYRDGPIPWNEAAVAEECLAERGFSGGS